MKKLEKFLAEHQLTEEKAIELLAGIYTDPAKDLYSTIVAASRIITKNIKEETLNLDDPFQKSLFQLLQTGDKVTKTVRAAQLEAYPDGKIPGGSEPEGDDDVPLADRRREKR